MKTTTHCLFFLITACIGGQLVAACGASSRITGSWKSPDAARKKPYEKVLVAALTNDVGARQRVENELVSHLQRKGVQATRSIDVFPPTFTQGKLPPRGEIIERIRQSGHDAVLTASLLDSDTETRYIPGTIGYAPVRIHPYYGNFYGYYSHFYPQVYSPGYYASTETYFMASEKLLWSAQSATYDPSSLNRFSKDFAKLTVSRLSRDGVL